MAKRFSGVQMMLMIAVALLSGTLIGISVLPAPQQQLVMSDGSVGYVTTRLPAIDQSGYGVAALLTVETRPGGGRILSNIDRLLFWVDTQQSIQTAREVAQNYTGISSSAVDLIYTINAFNASVVGGPSAGAAIAVATIAALEGRPLRQDVMITGTINPDGSIGQVGSVTEKAIAAKQGGASLFLVPPGQSLETSVKAIKSCDQRGSTTFCETNYRETSVNVGEKAGIIVMEIANISEALGYFFE